MALLTETNEQYYAGQQGFTATAAQTTFVWTGDVDLVATTSTSYANFKLLVDNVEWTPVSGAPGATQYQLSSANTITVPAMVGGEIVVIKLLDSAKWENNGSYAYIKLVDVINNFMVAYVYVKCIV